MEIELVDIAASRRRVLKIGGSIAISALGLALGIRESHSQGAAPAIFYSPHQDDEAIGMAGGIAEHKDAGRPVYLVLLTNGVNDDLLTLANSKLQSNSLPTITMEQMMWGRRSEFVASAQAMGVDRTFIVNIAQGFDDREPYNSATYAGFVQRVVSTIEYFESQYPGASHKLASDESCTTCSPPGPNLTHQACCEAGRAVLAKGAITDFRFYRIYEYLKPVGSRTGQYTVQLSSSWMTRKRKALDQYKMWDPAAGRYGLGYLSVPTLIDAAYSDAREFVDL
ncbi:glcNAc-PI de-N-acetylase family protein [Burkholderia multivorans]|uniref:PIG-L deacetylase family protein n=1 Tax=Burkholderia multivorans TaxID=87883 RepID=UPI0005102D8E|nr:PIG-L family deacetylase [Burkholderia multivorans]KGC03581.1 glcNAc-PI de-N-acetylase family protein [Burkholderia multivorans]